MPRGDFNVYFASRGGPHVRTEVAAGIALLVFILAALLILGCWYFRRCGYKMIRSPRSGSLPGFSGRQFNEGGATAENKMGLSDLRPLVPNANPAYETISSGPLPPPSSP
ncbi:melanoma antigen recognized by T-cells 1-like [Oncorhynchus tshawytscha]|uniref:melanoma antigen recognized by T-cells 1-like n=1 Tax=Oncorhynchus tshawytscha TaxID=74940 RepID=UPI000D09B04A|nr:melanoma antigen recognized by T-cells 1-like [Oncorhynchus tshawytscha]XP_042182473.1 melanoma antigen recognized by T-cells 1-like [Oncorhynchus tshawytscha]